jgi:hypothetical protein
VTSESYPKPINIVLKSLSCVLRRLLRRVFAGIAFVEHGPVGTAKRAPLIAISRITQPNSRRLELIKIKILDSECQTSGKYAKRAKQATQKIQRRGLLVFSDLPSLPSAGSRSGCFRTALGCKPRSLTRVSLGWFYYSKKSEEGRSNSGLFASKRSKTPHGTC